MFDMLILGYGPAGISAALYGLRAGLSVQLVGKDGGALAKAHMIQNYYGLEKPLTGEQLLEVGHKQAMCRKTRRGQCLTPSGAHSGI